MSERNKHRQVYRDGKWQSPEAPAVSSDLRVSHQPAISSGKPWTSVSMAIDPRDVAAENEKMRAHNVRGYYDTKGRPHVESRGGRNDFLKYRQMMDRDGGFGDYTGR